MQKFLVGAALALLLGLAPAFAGERSEVPEKYTWNVADLYATKQAWVQAREALAGRLPEIDPFRGHLGDSAQNLLKALETWEDLQKELARVYVYAFLQADVDTRNSETQAMLQTVQKLENDLETRLAFFEPEVLALGDEKVGAFLEQEPDLVPFRQVLDNIMRRRAHTLSPAEEKVASRMGVLAEAPRSIYTIFTNAEMPFPEVVMEDGTRVRLDQSAYGLYRASPSRAEREKVFRTFWKVYQDYRKTLGLDLFNHVKGHVANKELRNYDSCVAAALDRNNVPTSVYHQLLKDVNANLATLHRYLRLRKRMMGLDQLGYEDLYTPLVASVEMDFTPEQAMDLTLEACAPLGPDYVAALKKGYAERWVDFMPSTGKRSGAYSTGDAYDVHPYQLLNFNGKYDDVSTLAHESGHSMHSYLSNKNQRYANSNYSIFIAEVASTLNEDLLFHYTLDHATDDATRLYLLGERLESYRTTLFRQALFAEFELAIHEKVEKGEPLTGDSMNALYLDLLRRYYGHDQGVCRVDDLYSAEWAFIPHFYRNFYVFQYATSLMASATLGARIREEAPKGTTAARDAYLEMLSSGSIRYPVALLQEAGVDMTTSVPFTTAMGEMNDIMDRIEALLDKADRAKAKG